MSDAEQKPRADRAFTAFMRIETLLLHTLATMRGAGARAVADEADAAGQYGNVKIKFSPKAWRGENYKGSLSADCPSAFLDLYADTIEAMALRTMSKAGDRDDEKKLTYARYDLRDAALVRRWAILNKGKPAKVPTAAPTPQSAQGGDWPATTDAGDPWAATGNNNDPDW